MWNCRKPRVVPSDARRREAPEHRGESSEGSPSPETESGSGAAGAISSEIFFEILRANLYMLIIFGDFFCLVWGGNRYSRPVLFVGGGAIVPSIVSRN